MSAIIKGGNGNNFIYNGRVSINNEIKEPITPEKKVNPFLKGLTPTDIKKQQQPIPEQPQYSAPQNELDALRQHYINEGKKQAELLTASANQEASEIAARSSKELIAAQEQARALLENAHAEMEKMSSEIKKQAYEEGYRSGNEEGKKTGYDEGYLNGLKKCKDTLLELKKLNGEILKRKARLMQSYEHEIFDTALAIAQKITVNSLKQKDKAVLQKMLKESVKEFRNAKMIKITLSELDVSEEAEVDLEQLRDLFTGSAQVEFEILKNADTGTLIIDNGSEIIDTSVSTQLKMIEELGRGKYRDKKAEKEVRDEAFEEAENAETEEKEVVLEEVAPEEETAQAQEADEALIEEAEEISTEAVEEPAQEESVLLPAETSELTLIDDSGAEITANELEKKSEEMARLEADKKKAELEHFERLEEEHKQQLEKENKKQKAAVNDEAEEKTSTKRPRKPTNPLLSKMIDNLGE